MEAKIDLPPVFKDLWAPARLKVYYGGRGGGKSESIARYLLIEGAREKMNILCAREFQSSIKESVHSMLASIVERHGLSDFYTVLNTEIRGANGTQFMFAGLRHNIASIKSMHDIKKCWVEEAETVSDHSWTVLLPTIRADDSEIIVSFNPDIEDSPTYQRMVVNAPDYAIVKRVNYTDNPYFNEVLRQEMEECKEKQGEEAFKNIWLGECKSAVEGAVFRDEMRALDESDRITHVPLDLTKPVDAFLDLGRGDYTSIWFAQMIGFEYRILRFYEDNRKHFSHYISKLQEYGYNYGTIYLPHDAANETLAAEKNIEQQARAAFQRVHVLPRLPVSKGIEAVRSIFPNCYFDKELCADGLDHLRRYAYKFDEEKGTISREPDHNIHSHGADAFRYLALAMKGEKKKPRKKPTAKGGWQGKLHGNR